VPGSAVNSSTANKVTIREAGPASNDGYVVPVVMAAAASVRRIEMSRSRFDACHYYCF
jgi:hypothetical protein